MSDFGLAKFFLSKVNKVKLYTTCGTASYIAPEIVNEQPYDEKCDVWSLGVILYTMLCGYTPFNDADEKILLQKIKNDEVEFDEANWKDISDEAKSLIKQMLVKDVNNRISLDEVLKNKWLTESNKDEQLPFTQNAAKRSLVNL